MGIINFGHAKHAGLKREHNEDNYLIDEQLGLWIVADGMGGHECGEVASQIVVDLIHDKIKVEVPLQDAVQKAHEVVLLAADQRLGLPGMGSTVVVLRIIDDHYEIAWVGDSRAYLWDEGQLRQLTRDHSFVQQLLETGEISVEEAQIHPHRNIITQAIGAGDLEKLNVDVIAEPMYRGQQVLLCSDGLTDEVSDSDIATVLADSLTEQEKVDKLIQMALDNGGSDNVTVLLVSAPETAPARPSDEPTMQIKVDQEN